VRKINIKNEGHKINFTHNAAPAKANGKRETPKWQKSAAVGPPLPNLAAATKTKFQASSLSSFQSYPSPLFQMIDI
jgi:hypothetical protein